jgi:hypothetical protein
LTIIGITPSKIWVYYFRKTLPTFGTNTNNHLESFNNNIKISVNHHLHLSASIEEILAITVQTTVVTSDVCINTSSETISFSSTASDYSIHWYSNSSNSY